MHSVDSIVAFVDPENLQNQIHIDLCKERFFQDQPLWVVSLRELVEDSLGDECKFISSKILGLFTTLEEAKGWSHQEASSLSWCL